ncbi:hypothetical protein RJ035_006658 [Blastomyces gilchristii]
MTNVDTAPQFGSELRVSNGIAWLEEVQQFYRERSAIEKEYAAKLTGLCRKYHERKSKKSSSLSVGDTPALTPGSLESASLTTWTTQLSAIEAEAADRDRFGSDLVVQIAEPLKQAAARFEELRKNHVEYSTRLEKERDATYSDLKKVKGKYDGACQEVENRRKKTESSFDHGKQKVQMAYQQQTLEMNNVKGLQDLNETRVSKLNSIWTLAAQLEKDTLTRCEQHVSHLLSEIPRNEPRLDSTMFIRHNMTNWQDPADVQFEPSPVWHDDAAMITDETAKVFLRNILVKSKAQAKELKVEADKKRREVENAKKIRQSIRDGRDKRDEAEVVRAIFAMQEDLHLLDRKRLTAEVETSTITSVVGDLSFGAENHNFRSQTFKIPTNCDLCGERIWGLSAKGFDCRDCGYTCHSKCEMKVPAECPGEQTKEEKKKLKIERQEAASSAPPIDVPAPTNGASELPALSRRDTMNSLSSGYAASGARSASVISTPQVAEGPTELPASSPATTTKPATAPRRNRIVAPPPAQYISAPPPPANEGDADGGGGRSRGLSIKSSEARGKMLYPYEANGEDEITVEGGREVTIVEPDDGSGWMRVRAGALTGLVPASYVEGISTPSPAFSPRPSLADRPGSTYSTSSASLASSVAAKRRGPAVAPKRGAKKLQYVVALYDYEARSDAEWSMAEGDRFVLVNRDSGNGWSDVEKGGQTKSVPANYIEEV